MRKLLFTCLLCFLFSSASHAVATRVFYDPFTEATPNKALTIHDTAATGGTGIGWTSQINTCATSVITDYYSPDTIRPSVSDNNCEILLTANVTATTPDVYKDVQMLITYVNAGGGATQPEFFVWRFTDTNNYGVVLWNKATVATDCYIGEVRSGTWATISSGNCDIAIGSVLKVEVIGAQVRLYDDDVLVLSGNATISAAGEVGLGVGAVMQSGGVATDDTSTSQELDTFDVYEITALSQVIIFSGDYDYRIREMG